MASESNQRFSTEISDENHYKYRVQRPIGPGSLYYGKDSDMLYKSVTGAKRGAIIGLGIGLAASTYQKSPFSFAVAAEKGFRHSMPWVIAGTTYGLGLSVAANVRHKEGPMNHVIGGYAAGTMIGAWYSSMKLGVWSALILGGVAGMWKMMMDKDAHFRGEYRRPRVFNYYRMGWGTDRPSQEGRADGSGDDSFKKYRP